MKIKITQLSLDLRHKYGLNFDIDDKSNGLNFDIDDKSNGLMDKLYKLFDDYNIEILGRDTHDVSEAYECKEWCDGYDNNVEIFGHKMKACDICFHNNGRYTLG